MRSTRRASSRVETDLAEHIVQLAGDRPSHIVWPALHKTREQVGELFRRTARRSGSARQRRGDGRQRPPAVAAEIHARGRRHIGREFPRRRHRRGLHRHQRRQRRADHHPAARAYRDRGDREARAVDRACDDLLRLLVRSATGAELTQYTTFHCGPTPARRRRRAGSVPHRAGRQRPHAHARRRTCRHAALPALRGLPQPLRRLSRRSAAMPMAASIPGRWARC